MPGDPRPTPYSRLFSASELMHGTTPDGLKAGLAFMVKKKAEEAALATYKVQVNFGTGRSSRPDALNTGVVTFWLSGSKLHGGGDEMIYLCSKVDFGSSEYEEFQVGRSTGGAGCGAFIVPDLVRGGVARCPRCERMIDAKQLTAQIYFNTTNRSVARGLARFFRLFEHDADVVIKYAEDDIRYLTVERLYGVEEARKSRGALVYTLVRIIKDTAGGATLEDRFNALVSA